MIFGTAGHVDHGKSALVLALTGTDPDRLAEEKAREMTIDLGFAFLPLPGLESPVAIVDVPGHEMFVRNMVAGATGIDAAIFVIAADKASCRRRWSTSMFWAAFRFPWAWWPSRKLIRPRPNAFARR